MQSEWNKWLTGLTSFKEDQGMLLIFVLAIIVAYWKKDAQNQRKLIVFTAGMAVCILCPLTAVILLKGYTPFYDWLDLQLLLPMVIVLAWGGTEFVFQLSEMEVPGVHLNGIAKTIISIFCAIILLFSGTVFHGLDPKTAADQNGVPVEVAEIFEPIYADFGDKPLVLAAPSKILKYTKLYEANWKPLYGRDLWSPKAASYINSGYDVEYELYELLEKAQLDEEEFVELTNLIFEEQVDCVIVPSYWIADMEKLTGQLLLVDLTDAYTGIIKEDLMKE